MYLAKKPFAKTIPSETSFTAKRSQRTPMLIQEGNEIDMEGQNYVDMSVQDSCERLWLAYQ
jgi:hypothetical protein